jgi:hypothetical protein
MVAVYDYIMYIYVINLAFQHNGDISLENYKLWQYVQQLQLLEWCERNEVIISNVIQILVPSFFFSLLV